MKTLLLSWTPGPKGTWYADHPLAQGTGAPSYRIRRTGRGYMADHNYSEVSGLMATPEDAAWCASMHALRHVMASARKCQHSRDLLDAIATASLDALHRSPLGGRASA